jgi:hypothetical protein
MDELDTLHEEASTGEAPTRPLPPARANFSMRPALVVVGIAAGLILAFSVFAGITNQGSGTVSDAKGTPTKVRGTPLKAIRAADALKSIQQPGEPPSNIVDAVRVPTSARVVSHTNNGGEADQYDEQVELSVTGSQADLIDFYQVEMQSLGWHIFSTGAATNLPGGIQVLGQKAGDDGWYWDMGAIISPTTFPTSGANTGADVTKMTIRLFQVPDAS